jgi:transcriptional regulator with XRE-family HTH domain
MSLLGETVKIRREELRLDQLELGRRVGVGQQTVSRWETGQSMPKANRLPVLAEVLELDSEYLHRMAGYLPADRSSPASDLMHAVYERVPEFSDDELVLVLDRLWQELRRRRGMSPPGVS